MRDKAFNIVKNRKYVGYQFFDKKSSVGAVTCVWSDTLQSETSATQAAQEKSAIENKIVSNQWLHEELHKLIIRKFEKQKVYSSFKDNI